MSTQNANQQIKLSCAGDPDLPGSLKDPLLCIISSQNVIFKTISTMQTNYSTSPIFVSHYSVLEAASPQRVWGLSCPAGAFPDLQRPLLSAQPPPVCFITYSGNRIPLGVILSFPTGCSKLDPLPLLSSDRLPFCGAVFHIQFLHLKQKSPHFTVLEQLYSVRTFIQHCKEHSGEATVSNLRNNVFTISQLWMGIAWSP